MIRNKHSLYCIRDGKKHSLHCFREGKKIATLHSWRKETSYTAFVKGRNFFYFIREGNKRSPSVKERHSLHCLCKVRITYSPAFTLKEAFIYLHSHTRERHTLKTTFSWMTSRERKTSCRAAFTFFFARSLPCIQTGRNIYSKFVQKKKNYLSVAFAPGKKWELFFFSSFNVYDYVLRRIILA